ncbi:hypothetical protein SLEP1_g22817 [Rubroshorea leprosula]|uniref:Chromo domain-containing protein n=1 Tax=Rubroshorea leprosula TaxID=152421 RepID=A0AAV5JAG9_9ROSI|nr:hypothetical protein SLEP1_g22817 [Rubroshorea leprosula]
MVENTRLQELCWDLSEFQRKHDADVASLDKRMTSMENALREEIAKVLQAVSTKRGAGPPESNQASQGQACQPIYIVRSLENPIPSDPVASMTKFGKVDFPSYNGTDNFRGWLYKCNRFFKAHNISNEHKDPIVLWKNLNQTGSVSDYEKEFERIRAKELSVNSILKKVWAPLPSLKSLPPLLPLPLDSQRLPLPNSSKFSPINLSNNPLISTIAKNRPRNVKSLFEAELEDKKQKGLCFWCDERYGPGHRCSKKKLYNLEIISIDEDAESVETNDKNFDLNQMLITEPQISIHALTSEVGYNTIKVIGQVGKRQILILIDSRSTHNFLNAKLAKELGCEIKGAKSYQVTLVDGSKIIGAEKCDKFEWEVQGHVFTAEVMLLPLREYDLILGIQWLKPLGQVLWDFKLRTLHFKYKSQLVHIEAAHKPAVKWVENDKLLSLLLKKEQDDRSDYFLVRVISKVDSICSLNAIGVAEKSVDLRKLLEEFSENSWYKDPRLQQLMTMLQTKSNNDGKYSFVDHQLRRKGKLMVGNDMQLRTRLMQMIHAEAIEGHSRVLATTQRLSSLVYWKGMKKDIRNFIQGYHTCQLHKYEPTHLVGLLQPLPLPHRVWEQVSMDFIDDLPSSQGYTTIMIVVDWLSKYAHFIPVMHPYTTSKIAQLYLSHIYKLHGMPKKVGPVAYKLQLPENAGIHNVFLVSLLKKKVGNAPVTSQFPDPLVHNGQHLLPDKILERRLQNCHGKPVTMWLIQWKGCTAEEASWETSADILARFPDFHPNP